MTKRKFYCGVASRLTLVLLFTAPFYSASADLQSNDYQQLIEDAQTVDEAVSIVTEVLEDQGYDVVLQVDHAAAAASVGLDLAPTQVLMARQPKLIERRFLHQQTTLGIDLPIKILLYEDSNNTVQLRVNSLAYLIDRHQLPLSWVEESYRNVTQQFVDSNNGLVTVRSQRSVSDTADALVSALEANPAFRVPLVLDYRLRGRRHGPVLVVFGNPNAGTPLMQATQEVAIDLPQKMLIWKRQGEVYITYNDPFYIAARHQIGGQDTRLATIANALANFAQAAAGN